MCASVRAVYRGRKRKHDPFIPTKKRKQRNKKRDKKNDFVLNHMGKLQMCSEKCEKQK